MLCHIEKMHEANLLYCVLLVANCAHIPLAMSSKTIIEWTHHTYEQFCLGDAMLTDLAESSVAHKNLLPHMHDFVTILQAQRAMKYGDYGRLMYMWDRWAIITQGLGKMPHYSKGYHLPRLIVQLKYILPNAIAQVVMNTLLISPKGKAGHFMATDQYLENYWLKYFCNHSEIGTGINRLKVVCSSTISVLCYPLELLKLKSGAQVVHQSHKNKISLVLLNNFCHMAKSECMGESPPSGLAPQAIADCYLAGMCKLQHEFTKNGLARFWPYCPGIKAMEEADRMTKEQM
ncbi:hypothetical protein PSTG_09989 [Puccinia striiformis f. sp. tritici PST-78]|uniref:DUF6589 domain-containing protein n=1 Tax=Puccinia striiformis f. sp. tritici PST-78 TaxID=1165861 RepID=A0A0L0VBS4_9BASI|nr:hypothetical protein PSTG_09989 [Puccinia striiformis f. sp. tritici PST-78]